MILLIIGLVSLGAAFVIQRRSRVRRTNGKYLVPSRIYIRTLPLITFGTTLIGFGIVLVVLHR